MQPRLNSRERVERTQSERLFEHYLNSVQISDYEYHPRSPVSRKRPDYRLFVHGEQLFCEVAEFDSPIEFEPALAPRKINQKLTDKIQEEWKQLKDIPIHPRCIVLHASGQLNYLTGRWWIWGAMLGVIEHFTPCDPQTGLVYGRSGPRFSREGGQMVWDTGEARKENLGAIVVVEELNVGERRFLASPSPYPSLSRVERALRVFQDECKARGTERDCTLREPRVVVYRNPLATTELPAKAFCGPYDEHYSYTPGWPGRVERRFVGEGLRRLESGGRGFRGNWLTRRSR
jgi:hypothetical protein